MKLLFRGPGHSGRPAACRPLSLDQRRLSSGGSEDEPSRVPQGRRGQQIPGPRELLMCAGCDGWGCLGCSEARGEAHRALLRRHRGFNCKATQSWVDGSPGSKGGTSGPVTLTLSRATGGGWGAAALAKGFFAQWRPAEWTPGVQGCRRLPFPSKPQVQEVQFSCSYGPRSQPTCPHPLPVL